MRTRAAFLAGLALSLATIASACGSNDATPAIPEHPSFETDVKPITTANCIRCHGMGGELNTDSSYGTPPNGFFDQYEDPPDCVVTYDAVGIPHACRGAACPAADETTVFVCRGFRYYSMPAASPVLLIYVPLMMPPPPAPKLKEREVEILKRWAAAPLP